MIYRNFINSIFHIKKHLSKGELFLITLKLHTTYNSIFEKIYETFLTRHQICHNKSDFILIFMSMFKKRFDLVQ